MKGTAAVIMLVGLVAGLFVWVEYENSAQSAIHQVYAVALGMKVIVGGYVLARALELLGAVNKEKEEVTSTKRG